MSDLGLLRRFLEPAPKAAPGELCEMCTEKLAQQHSHVVNTETRQLMCTCRGCWMLFTREGAAQGRFRAVHDRHRYDPALRLTPAQWDAMQIPVSMAFFFFNSSLERYVAFYPSPGGATESLLELDVWDEVLAANPGLADLAPDVEALLIEQREGGFAGYLVPIDACYELVGTVRMRWKGFDGGQEAWEDIAAFFQRLRERSEVVQSDHG
jgi:Family of unknown function (DUF5947)